MYKTTAKLQYFFVTTKFFCTFAAVMLKNILFLLIYIGVSLSSLANETRAVWLTTIGGIDWPHSYSSTIQKEELTQIFDDLAAAGINTILLQTRIRATTIFPSSMEPFDGCLTGHPGKGPDYDALQFAIEECHRRGMKLHAWIVTIPIGKWKGEGCRKLRSRYPKMVKKIGDEGFLNPEASGTADYIADFCKEVTEKYDIDGIHLDYIRYPDSWGRIRNRSEARNNITRIVKAVHREVKALKPWVQLSCSPVGKYSDTKRQSSVGWNARDVVCQDVALWMQEGLMDAIYPMMYFRNQHFYPFVIDWKERSNGRIVAPGLGVYMLHRSERNWPLDDITREMYVLRQYGMGITMFRSKFLTDDTKGIYQFTKDFNALPALQPAMTWYDVTPPVAPEKVKYSDGILSWEDVGGDVTYNVYCSETTPVDTQNPENLVMADYHDTSIKLPPLKTAQYFAVTATDRYGNESPRPVSKASKASGKPVRPQNINTLLADVPSSQMILVCTIHGNALFLGYKYNLPTLSPGHYKVYLQGKKIKNRHLLGWGEVPLK